MSVKSVGIIGIGFVGGAILKSFLLKKINVFYYDKYKKSNTIDECLKCDILFLCLPTQFNQDIKKYDTTAIKETLELLNTLNYNGLIVIKSTVEPETTHKFSLEYPKLKLFHNPEFLSAKTAFEDFHNQTHIVLGRSINVNDEDVNLLNNFYSEYYPSAEISLCSSTESESMKSFCNCFYSVKIQFFNELYLLCKENGSNYNNVLNLMLKNNWINPMHTNVPGTDGKLSYGGFCFPKDTNALLAYMKRNDTPSKVLEACILERNEMREDHLNIKNLLKDDTLSISNT